MAKRKAARFDKGNPTHVRRAFEKRIKRDRLIVALLGKLERLKAWAAEKPSARRVTRRKARKATARRKSAK